MTRKEAARESCDNQLILVPVPRSSTSINELFLPVIMALVPRDGSSRKSKPVGDGNKDFGNTIKLMSFRDFTIKENGKDRRIFDFLSHQLQSSWHPSFRYTTVVIRTLADCLYALSSQKRADMKFFWKVDNTELPGLNQ